MWYVCDGLYAVLYVCVSCFVVSGCAVSRMYIDVCNCNMFRVVKVYLDHLKFYVVCINGRMYVCCDECYVVSNECDEPTSCLVHPISSFILSISVFRYKSSFRQKVRLNTVSCMFHISCETRNIVLTLVLLCVFLMLYVTFLRTVRSFLGWHQLLQYCFKVR